MICPYCGCEMQQGYIQSRDGAFWTPEKVLVPALTVLKRKAIPLSDYPGTLDTSTTAHLCRECKKVIIDFDRD